MALKTTPVFLPADEASWSLLPSSVSLLSSGDTVQPENTSICVLYILVVGKTGQVWETKKKGYKNTNHSYYQRSSP